MPSASVHLFVYGSLKRGGRHHDELEGATFLGPAETAPGYRLEPLGEYLALVEAEPAEAAEQGSGCVPGELFEVPLAKLPALDAFEGDAYVRAEVPVRLAQAEPERHATKAQAQPERHKTETERHPTKAQAQPERHETETETERHPTKAQAQPERHETETETERHPTKAQAQPERHETETETHATGARGNSAETRLALAYLRKAR